MCQTNTQYITITPITAVKQANTTPQTTLSHLSGVPSVDCGVQFGSFIPSDLLVDSFISYPAIHVSVGLLDIAYESEFRRSRRELFTSGGFSRRSLSSSRPVGSISHTQSSWENVSAEPYLMGHCRDVGISVTPAPIQHADMGVMVNVFTHDDTMLSSREEYNLRYKLGRIAESQVSVCPSTNCVHTQTAWSELQLEGYMNTVLNVTDEVIVDEMMHHVLHPSQPTRSARTQTDLLDWDMSESTTKLHRQVRQIRFDSAEEITQSVEFQSHLLSDTYSLDHSPQEHSEYEQAIRCRVRQRTAQYELLEVRHEGHVSWNDSIKEVASPITGRYVPVGTAIRAGWVQLGNRNLYVDPTTGLSIPLEAAIARGLVRLHDSDMDSDPYDPSNMPSLLLIERITFSWHPVRIVSYIDTRDAIQYSIEDALERGFIHISTGEPIILDRETGTWTSTEEAALRGVIQIEMLDSDESDSSLMEETYSCRVFRICGVRPGGEPSDWLDPLEAARIGLFNWQTGDVAAEWRTKPDAPPEETEQDDQQQVTHCIRHSTYRCIPTRWCSLLTARKARWLRLQAELHPADWISSISSESVSRTGHRILAKHVHLFAPSTISINPPAPMDYTLSSQSYSESVSESYSAARNSSSPELAPPRSVPLPQSVHRHRSLSQSALLLSPSPPPPLSMESASPTPPPPARYTSGSTHTVTQMEHARWGSHMADRQDTHRLLDRYAAYRTRSDAMLQESTLSAHYSTYEHEESNVHDAYYQQYEPHPSRHRGHRMYMSEEYLQYSEEVERSCGPSRFQQQWDDDSDSFM